MIDPTGRTLKNIQIKRDADAISRKVKNIKIPQIQSMGAELALWVHPTNELVKLVSSLLKKSSDYLNGVKFAYERIDNEAGSDEKISDISEVLKLINIIEPSGDDVYHFVRELSTKIPIFKQLKEYSNMSGEIGWVSDAELLVKFVAETLKAVTDIIETVVDVMDSTLAHQKLSQARNADTKAQMRIDAMKGLDAQMKEIRVDMFDKLLKISTAYSKFSHFKHDISDADKANLSTAADLTKLCKKISNLLGEIENFNGNAFMIVRFCMEAIRAKKITKNGPTKAQFDNITDQLFALEKINSVFKGNKDQLRLLVVKFFRAGLFKNFSVAFSSNSRYLSSTPSRKEEMESINDSKYDPDPSLSIDDIPLPNSTPAIAGGASGAIAATAGMFATTADHAEQEQVVASGSDGASVIRQPHE